MKKNIKSLIIKEIPFFLSVPALVWQILFFYLPLLFIVFISFKQINSDLLHGFTITNYATFFSFSYVRILVRSFFLALLTSCVCLLIGYPVAYYIARTVYRWKNVLLFFLILPFWTNMLVQVYAWFAVLDRNGIINNLLLNLGIISQPLTLLNTPLAIYLVMVYYYLPFMVIPLYAILEKLENEYLEASMDLGARPLQTFFNVTLPLSMSGVTTGFFLVFIPAFGEFVIPGLMGGNKYMYVGSLISYYYLFARNEPLGAAFTVFSGILLIISTIILYRFFAHFITRERGL